VVIYHGNRNRKSIMTTANFRIESIQHATLNGRAVKLFKAFKRQGDAFVFVGQFAAPARTANKNLAKFIE
jgi:hypothetical protein